MDGHSKNEEILYLLRSKNRCLDRLMEATRVFLREPIEALVGDVPTESNPLSAYENERNAIVRTLEMHDRRINDLIGELTAEDREYLRKEC